MMTKIEQLKAAHDAATPGEWVNDGWYILKSDWRVRTQSDAYIGEANAKDAEFITLAHKMMPQLLEAVEALDNLAASFESVMLQYGPQMSTGDQHGRGLRLSEAQAALTNLRELVSA